MTALSTWVRTLAGPAQGTFLHIDSLHLDTATTVTTGRPAKIDVYQPWTHTETKGAITLHPAAVWSRLVALVAPGPGVFGRAVVLYCGWGSEADAPPTTIAAMTKLQGYKNHTYGGAADPGEADRTFRVEFNENRSDVLKMRDFPIGGRVVFYYCFTEAKFGTTQVDGPRFVLSFDGEYECLGRN